MRRTTSLCGLLALSLCSQLLLASTQEDPATNQGAKITPEARQLIDRVDAFYKSLDAVTLEARMEISDERMPEPMTQSARIAIGRPNLLKSDDLGNDGGIDAASNGTELTIAMNAFKIYSVSPAPTNFQSVVRAAFDGSEIEADTPGIELTQDPKLLIALSMMGEQPGLQMLQGVEKVSLGADEPFNGTDAHTLMLETTLDPARTDQLNPIANAKIWIAKGDKPWVLGITPEFETAEPDMGLSVKVVYSDWATGAPAEGYSLAIPEGWKKVDDLMQSAVTAAVEQLGDELETPDAVEAVDPFHPTEGTPAPEFTLKTLDGSQEVTLASLKGQVVVLDFWATWCAPCVAGLPTVDSVTADFKDQGVVFYAVDLREKTDRVKKFMTKKGWTFPVLMDQDGEVAKSFGVGGIPHSVLIDRKGEIRYVHIGFGGKEALESQLREELEGLVSEGQNAS